MHTDIQLKVNRLNQLYHRIVTGRYVDEELDTEQFKNLIKQIKGLGYKFRVAEVAFADDRYFQTDSVSNLIDFIPGCKWIDAFILF